MIDGIDIWHQPLVAKQHIGVLPEGLNLYERLTAREFVRFTGSMYGLPADLVGHRSGELIGLMDLEEDADNSSSITRQDCAKIQRLPQPSSTTHAFYSSTSLLKGLMPFPG